MLTELLTAQNQAITVIGMFALAVVGSLAKAYISYRKTWVEQESRTNRLTQALKGTRPHQRPEIIRAFGQFERGPAAEQITESSAASPATAPVGRTEDDTKRSGS